MLVPCAEHSTRRRRGPRVDGPDCNSQRYPKAGFVAAGRTAVHGREVEPAATGAVLDFDQPKVGIEPISRAIRASTKSAPTHSSLCARAHNRSTPRSPNSDWGAGSNSAARPSRRSILRRSRPPRRRRDGAAPQRRLPPLCAGDRRRPKCPIAGASAYRAAALAAAVSCLMSRGVRSSTGEANGRARNRAAPPMSPRPGSVRLEGIAELDQRILRRQQLFFRVLGESARKISPIASWAESARRTSPIASTPRSAGRVGGSTAPIVESSGLAAWRRGGGRRRLDGRRTRGEERGGMAFMLEDQGVDHDSGQHGRQRGAGVSARGHGAQASQRRGEEAGPFLRRPERRGSERTAS